MSAKFDRTARLRAPRGRQEGVVLFIALIVMVAMALAGLALIRSVDTAVVVAGNLAFKQGATNAGDQGLEAARTWLVANKDALSDDKLTPGTAAYYSNWQATVDLVGTDPERAFNWNTNALQVLADDGAGNRVRYVIHRLCNDSNTTPSSTTCVKVASTTTGSAASGGSFGGRDGYRDGGGSGGINLANTNVYYRITVRIDGPRNTTSYVQALMY